MYREDEKTKLTLSQGGTTMTWEGDSAAGLTEILDGFIGCLRGLTFGEWVVGRTAEYCAELAAEAGGWKKPEPPEPFPENPEITDSYDLEAYHSDLGTHHN